MRSRRWTVLVFLVALSASSGAYCADYDQVLNDAKELAKAGNRAAAADLCEGAAGVSTDEGAQWLRGYALMWRDRTSDAIAQFFAVASLSSSHAPDALLRAANLTEKAGQDAGADWERLVRDYPGTKEAVEGLHHLGHYALRQGDPESAVARFEQSAALRELDPDMAEDSQLELGYAYISQYWKTLDPKCLPKALRAFDPVTKSANAERAIKAHLGRGEAYLRVGLPDPASREYLAVLQLQPEEPYYRRVALFELACCEYENERWTAAADAFDRFLADVPGGTLTEKDAQWKQARPDYACLIGTNPAKADALSGLELVPEAACWKAKALLEAGRASEAKAIADDLTTRFPGMRLGYRVRELQSACDAAIGEGK
jgi:tetratricopeptide (TPR) repeat protein